MLKAGDKIQIGRVEFFVREIKTEKDGLTKADYGTYNKIDNVRNIHAGVLLTCLWLCLGNGR